MRDPLGQGHTHLCPHAVKQGVEEAHERVQHVGVVEVDREEGDGEVQGGREGGEKHLLGLESLVGQAGHQVLEESEAVSHRELGCGAREAT